MKKLLFIVCIILFSNTQVFAITDEAITYAKKLSSLYHNTRLPVKIDTNTQLNTVKSNENKVNIIYKKFQFEPINKKEIQTNMCPKLKHFLNKGVIVKNIFKHDGLPYKIIVLSKKECDL